MIQGRRVRALRRADGPRRHGPSLFESLEPRCLLAAFDLIGVTALRNDPAFAGIDGSGVSVAVIDTGVDFDHPLLQSAFVGGADIARGGSDPTPTDPHGTHVAGIVGARDPSIGVATGTGLVGLQVFTPTRGGSVGAFDSDVERALRWVLDNRERFNIVAVNMSLGSGNYTSVNSADSSILFDDVKRLEAAGVTVVSAAGNSYGDLERPGSAAPAVFSTLSVGAVWEENEGGPFGDFTARDNTTGPDRVAYFSQRPNTAENAIFAPGALIRSTIPNNRFAEYPGTSMASPMVAGVVALMQEAAQQFGGRLLSPNEVRTIIKETADTIRDGDDEDTTVQTTGQTYDRVNAYNAVRRVRDLFQGGGGGNSADPNGTIGSAIGGPVLGGAAILPIEGNIGSDGSTAVGGKDVDLVRFTVTAPGTVAVTVTGAGGFDPLLRLFDSGGRAIAADDDSGPGGTGARVSTFLSPGTYFAGVSGAPNASYSPTAAGSGADGSTGNFTLSFGLASSDPDGLLSGAVPINLGQAPQALEESIGEDFGTPVGASDVDIYRIVVPDDGTLFVDIDTPFASGFVDSFLRIFDETGRELAVSDDNLATDVNDQAVELAGAGNTVVGPGGTFVGHKTDSFVGGGVSRGDVYYIAVSDFDNRNYDPQTLTGRPATGPGGRYNLLVTFVNRDVNGSIPQAVAASALPIANPGTIGADFGGAVGDRDVDFIRVNSPVAGVLEVDVDSAQAQGNPRPVDTVLRLFDRDGNLLHLNDNVDGNDPMIRIEIEANTDYYAAVAGYGNNNFDPFILGSGSPGATGDYEFRAVVRPLSDVALLSDDSADSGGVRAVQLGDRVRAHVGEDMGLARGADDVDVYRFVAPFSGPVQVQAVPFDDFGADTFLRVFDASGNEIARDDNGLGGTRGSALEVNLAAGQTYLIGVNGAGAGAGAYDPVTGSGAQAGSTGGYTLSVMSALNTIEFGGRQRAAFRDLDGDGVSIGIKGPGTGRVFFDTEGNANAARIVIDGATDATTLVIKGDTAVGDIVVNGSLKALFARSADLSGELTVTGGVSAVTLRDVTAARITAGPGGAASYAFRTVTDSSLQSEAAIKSLRAAAWNDADEQRDVVRAPSLGVLAVRGDFGADVTVDSLGKARVGGALQDAQVRAADGILSFTAGSAVDSTVFAGVAGTVSGLPDFADDFSNPDATLRSFVVKSRAPGAFSNTVVAAPTILKANLGGVSPDNGGVAFGVAAGAVRSISGVSSLSGSFRFRNLAAVDDALSEDDLHIRLL